MTDESRDGPGAADHDEAYRFGVHLTAVWHWPFTDQQFVRLMCLRGRLRDGELQGDSDGGDGQTA